MLLLDVATGALDGDGEVNCTRVDNEEAAHARDGEGEPAPRCAQRARACSDTVDAISKEASRRSRTTISTRRECKAASVSAVSMVRPPTTVMVETRLFRRVVATVVAHAAVRTCEGFGEAVRAYGRDDSGCKGVAVACESSDEAARAYGRGDSGHGGNVLRSSEWRRGAATSRTNA